MNVNYLLDDPKGGRERLHLGPLPHERGSPTAQLIWGFRSNKHAIADEQNCTGEKRGSTAEQLFAASPGEHQQRHDYCE